MALTAIVFDAAQPRLGFHLRPAGRRNILGQHHMPRHIGQPAPVGPDARSRSDRTVHPLPPSRSAHWPRHSRIQDAQSPDSPQAVAESTTPNRAAAYLHRIPFFKPMKSSLKQHEVIICFSHNVSPGKENAHHQVGGKSMLQMSECPRIALRLAENHNHYLKGVIMKFRI